MQYKTIESKRIYSRKWREAHQEWIQENRELHSEERKAYGKKWRESHKEDTKEYNKNYGKFRRENPNGVFEGHVVGPKEYKGDSSDYKREYYKSHKEKFAEYGYIRKYGITGEEYRNLFQKQGGVCAICKNPETQVIRGETRLLCVDHDHTTGKVRGLLCHNCNVSLGLMQDSPTILQSAIDYLLPG